MSLPAATAYAFAGRLAAATRSLATEPDRSERDGVRWLRAYLAAAAGNFRVAERSCRALVQGRSVDPIVRGRAAVTLGSVLRQTGRHAEARCIESGALATVATEELRRHLWIGLAADAVGLGDLPAVDAALATVASSRAGGWRAAVRSRWVRCERELLAGRPSHAVRDARSAVGTARRAGAQRHVAKSLLFLGVALNEVAAARNGSSGPGTAREAGRALRAARSLAGRIGARPIAEVAGELLGRSAPRR